MTVFEQVKKLTKSRSKTMKQVTSDLGYSENYFYSLKSGKQPTAERLSEIADYFGVTTDYLLGREEKPMQSEDKESNSQIEFRLEKDGLEDSDISDYVEDVQAYAEYRRKKLMEKKKK